MTAKEMIGAFDHFELRIRSNLLLKRRQRGDGRVRIVIAGDEQ